MYGVRIGNKHTYDDFGLMLKSKPTIEPPEVKVVEIDIPGADGKLDLSTVLNGYEVYYNRKITFEFNVKLKKEMFYRLYSKIANYLHGRKFNIILDDDISYYWYGRVTMNEMSIAYSTSTIKLTADVEPYKMEISNSGSEWLWDPFDFEQGIIREYFDLMVNGELEMTVIGSRKPVIPSIRVSSDMILEFDGVQYKLEEGINKVVNIELIDNEYTFKFIGEGTVTIDYRGGSL